MRASASTRTRARARAWAEWVFVRGNPKGPLDERWCHAHGCRRWFSLRRDTATDQVTATVRTTGVPNQLAVSPDGQWIYVAINDTGKADVIDDEVMRVLQADIDLEETLIVGATRHEL